MNTVAIVNKVKENALLIVMVFVALLVAQNVIKSREAQIQSLKAAVDTEEKKSAVLIEILQRDQQIRNSAASINSRASKAPMDALTAMAKKASVTIKSNRELEAVSTADGIVKTPIEVILTAPGYHKIGEFVSLIEQSKEIFIVDGLQVTPVQGPGLERLQAVLTLSIMRVPEKP